uniref:Protein bicaudal C 1-A n=1 Tax=Anthurium amnicola TaxID=1678845 RepID=A0A1D1YDB5_9ARAE
MDAPCWFHTFAPGVSLRNHPMLVSPPPIPSCSGKSFSPLVAVPMRAHGRDRPCLDGAQLMFRNVAALLYRSVLRRPKAGPGSTSERPSPGSSSDPDEEPEGEEEGVSEDLADELECLEEAAIAGTGEGREPGDYDRRAHLFDQSSRVFRALRDEREAHHRHHEGS